MQIGIIHVIAKIIKMKKFSIITINIRKNPFFRFSRGLRERDYEGFD